MAFAFPKQNNGQKANQVYTLGKELGSGAFSRVVLATRITDKKEFAIKIVDKDETDAKDMYKELEVMSKLSHPNLVNFEEIFDERDGFYVVLELITGGELFDRIIELQKYSEKDASSVLKDALLGLQHMHERGFAHRDIKPENLLLASKDSNAHVKVADFGFSTSTHNDHDLWETLGTPPYMAPEIVILRNEDVEESGYGRPVDVWALGICLYILLSGCHPYQQSDEEKMLCNIEQGVWPGWKRAETWKFISDDAKDLVKKMMDPKAASRLTVLQCLQHPWMLGQASGNDLTEIKDSIKAYQAKKKMRAAVLGVMATNKMRRGFSSLATINAQAAVQNANNNNNTNTTPQSAPLSAPVESKPIAPVKPANTIPDKPHDLLLKVTQGRNLIAKDANGKSDPYLNIWCGKYKFKTKTIKKTLNPEWNETFVIPYNACFAKTIEVDCMDYDLIGKDDFMGCFSLKVNSFHCGTPESRWVTLVPKPGAKKAKVSGDIQIEVTWRLSESS